MELQSKMTNLPSSIQKQTIERYMGEWVKAWKKRLKVIAVSTRRESLLNSSSHQESSLQGPLLAIVDKKL
jgi:hypothetical protein